MEIMNVNLDSVIGTMSSSITGLLPIVIIAFVAFIWYLRKKQLFVFKSWPMILWIRQQRENGEYKKILDYGRPITTSNGKVVKIERKSGGQPIDWAQYDYISDTGIMEVIQIGPDQYAPMKAVAVKRVEKADGKIDFVGVLLEPSISEAERIGIVDSIQNSQEKYNEPSWLQKNMFLVMIIALIATAGVIGYLLKDPATMFLQGTATMKEAAMIFKEGMGATAKAIVTPAP